jgi:NADH-quinone oxidoreductase subunit J
MLTRRVVTDLSPSLNPNWGWAMAITAVLFAGLVWILSSWGGFASTAPELSSASDPLVQLGQALVSPNAYILPFEVASVLLLAALIGAIIIAWDRK